MAKVPVAKNWSNIITVSGIKYSNPDNIPDVTVPTTPGAPTVTVLGTSSTSLEWTASTDLRGIKEYTVYRATSVNGTYSVVGTTILNNFVDTGLSASTTYYYKIKATDNSLNANVSEFSSVGFATTDAPAVASGPWKLAAGHYEPEVLPAVVIHPRPDSENTTNDRHRWAYYDMVNPVQYRIPIGIQGGSAPFYFTLLSGPPGMTIGRQYGDTDYGIVTWTPTGSVTDYPVSIQVNTQDDKVLIIDYTVSTSSSTSRFLFVDANAADNNGTGSINSPFKNTRGWFKDDENNTEHSGKIVYYRGGTHYWFLQPDPGKLADGSGTFIGTNKPLVHLGYPGETVVMDMRYCKITAARGARGVFFGGMRVTNSKKQRTNGMLRIDATCQEYNGGGMRFTRFELTVEGFPPTYIKRYEDLTGTNSRGETYSWINVAGTNEYYAVSNSISGKAFEGFTSLDVPLNLYADYNGTRTPMTKVASTATLSAGQWKWIDKDPTPGSSVEAQDFTFQVYLPDGTSPATKPSGWLIANNWQGNVGTNAGTFWSDESARINTVNGLRRYFLDSHVTFNYISTIDKDTGVEYDDGDNGPIACFMLNMEYGLQEFCTFTNCNGNRTMSIAKSSCRYLTRRFNDASSSTNALSVQALTMGNACEHDLTRTAHSHENCWNRIRFTSSTPSHCVLNFINGGAVPLVTDGPFASYRNTYLHTGNRGIYHGNDQFFTNMYINADLCLTNDSDGWILNVSQTLPATFRAPTAFTLMNTVTQATDINSTNLHVTNTNNTSVYGLIGATVA